MKKIIIIYICLLMFGCKDNNLKEENKKVKENKTTTTENKVETKVNKVETKISEKLDVFKKNLASLNKEERISISKSVEFYLNDLKNCDAKTQDEGYFHLMNFVQEMLERSSAVLNTFGEEKARDLLNAYFDLKTKGKITKEDKDFITDLKNNYLVMEFDEEMTFLAIDYVTLSEKFKSLVSPELKEYLEQKAKQTKETLFTNAEKITPLQISERLIFWNSFMSKYPEFKLADEIKIMNNVHINSLMYGYSGYHTNEKEKITEPFKLAYENVINKHTNKEIAKLIKDYLDTAVKLGYKDTTKLDEISAKILKLF